MRKTISKLAKNGLRWLFRLSLLYLTVFVTALFWEVFLLPTSLNEFLYRHRLHEAFERKAEKIRMADLVRFDWEEVCFHHAYDGDWRYEKYHRMYRAHMKGSDEGVVTLLFIKKDGSPTYFTGAGGAYIVNGARTSCYLRSEAALRLELGPPSRYVMGKQ